MSRPRQASVQRRAPSVDSAPAVVARSGVTGPAVSVLEEQELAQIVESPPNDGGRRRFTIAVVLGLAVAAVPYVWVLWGGGVDPLRSFYPSHVFSNFYEIQARALMNGHWYVPRGSLGIEGFIIHGREYSYFGPFSSILRMPILALTSSLDGRLTAPSMLLAWLVTGLFTSLLLWRVRVLVRGVRMVGRAEAGSYGLLVATIMSGSVLLYLASMPYVYDEDFAWGVALTIGSLFALLGVLERATTYRVAGAGVLILAAVLARTSTGMACVGGAFLVALWLGLGRGGTHNRRWAGPVVLAGLVPLLIGCYVSWAKFGVPFGLPLGSQVWTKLDPHRRAFLAANAGKPYNVAFLPTTLATYLRPDVAPLHPGLPVHHAACLPASVSDRSHVLHDLSDDQHPGVDAPFGCARDLGLDRGSGASSGESSSSATDPPRHRSGRNGRCSHLGLHGEPIPR